MTVCFAACSKEPDIQVAGDITIDASIGHMTKVSADGTNFTAGDAIALYAWTGDAASVPDTRVVDGVVNTFDGTRWTPATQMRWQKYDVAHYFLSIYPAPANVTSFTDASYTLDPADYTASDLLVATNLNGVTPSNGTVNLTFEHVMAKLGVNIKFGNEFASAPEVTNVTVSARRNATVNYLTGSVTATGDESYILLSAQTEPATGYKKSYSGLQVPQIINRITVFVAGKTYIYDSPAGITLTSGKFTNIGLLIGRDKIELDKMSVADWIAGESWPDANAELFDPYNGHEYVDMGLSVKWATCNIGADKQDECGDYFAWGETEPKNYYDWDTYKYCNGSEETLTKYCADSKYGNNGFTDDLTTLAPEDDAACVLWGASWRMPTKAEWEELLNDNNCTWVKKTTSDGYARTGYLVTSKINGNSIFLPSTAYRYQAELHHYTILHGYYLSSSLALDRSESSWALYFYCQDYDHNAPGVFRGVRQCGVPVRPVCP